MRLVLYSALALGLNLLLFQFMAWLVAQQRLGIKPILHAHQIEFVRVPQVEEASPPPRPRAEPPPPPQSKAAPATPAQPSAPVPANVRQLPLPLPGLKIDVPLSVDVGVAVPSLPSVLVEGGVSGPPGPVQVPLQPPAFISASELTAIARVLPPYPPSARRRRIEGYGVVEFMVTETGRVKDPKIAESQPPGVFDRAVLQAVRRWRREGRLPDDAETLKLEAALWQAAREWDEAKVVLAKG